MVRKFNTIHFVYALPSVNNKKKFFNRVRQKLRWRVNILDEFNWPNPIPAPLSITYNLISALRPLGNLKVYDIADTQDIILGENDIFIGHPWPDMKTKSPTTNEWDSFDPQQITNKVILKYPMDKRVYAISPFNFDDGQMAWAFPLIEKVQTYIGICGDIWSDNFDAYPGKNHFNKFIHVNMAIDMKQYSFIKKDFNPPGLRRLLYIGRASEEKGLLQMQTLPKVYPKFNGATLGCIIEGWHCLQEWGTLDDDFMKKVADSYDILISFSKMDAQATTVLEGMSRGLIVACTKETGYMHPSIFSLSVDNVNKNMDVFNNLQQLDNDTLIKIQEQNLHLLKTKYNWGVFTNRIHEILTSLN